MTSAENSFHPVMGKQATDLDQSNFPHFGTGPQYYPTVTLPGLKCRGCDADEVWYKRKENTQSTKFYYACALEYLDHVQTRTNQAVRSIHEVIGSCSKTKMWFSTI